MATYSPFWHKHYKDIGFCCTFQPLTESPVEDTPNKPHVDYYIDLEWMREKKMKWIGTNRNIEVAWIDPYGMVYVFNDLKRNERGKEWERTHGKLKLDGSNEVRQYADDPIDHYEWELKILKTCGFCHNRLPERTPEEKEKKGGEGGGPPVVDEEGLEALMSGDNSEYTDVTEDGDVTFSDQVTDSDEVLSSASEDDDDDDSPPQNDDDGDDEKEEDDKDEKPKDEKEEDDEEKKEEEKKEEEKKKEEKKKEEKLKEEKPPQKTKVAPPLLKNPVLNAKKVLENKKVLDNKLVTNTPFKNQKPEEEAHYTSFLPKIPLMQRQELLAYEEFRYFAPPQQKQQPKKKNESNCPPGSGLYIPVIPGTDLKTSEAFKVLMNVAGKYRNFIKVDQSGHVEVPDNPQAEVSDAGYDLLHAIASNSFGKKILFTVADQLEGRDRDTGAPVKYNLYRERSDSYLADVNFSKTPRGDKPRNNAPGTIDLHKLGDAIPVECFDGSVAIPTKSGLYKDSDDGSPRAVFYAKEKTKASLAFHALAENYYRTVENWRFPYAHDLAILWARKLSPNHPAFSLFPGKGVAIKLKDLNLFR